MEEIVGRNEILYRMVKRSQPDTMTPDGHPTSALFKDENGVSVDRDGSRPEQDILSSFKDRFTRRFKGLVRFGADVCLDNDIAVLPEPTDNIYHAAIYDDINKTMLDGLKALILADSAQVVAFEIDVQWT